MNKIWFSKNKRLVFLSIASIAAILTINSVGYFGAYLLTNYRKENKIALGYSRPTNKKTPKDFQLSYTSDRLILNRQEWIETWRIESSRIPAKGTVILFHGKGSSKSSLLASTQVFHSLGYDSLLVDFRGAGGSSGNQTTVGVRESEDVVSAFNKAQELNSERPIILYGVSMGSAAILRAIALTNIEPDGIILELPFATLLSAVKTRLTRSNIPAFPLGELMVFWGGIQHGFNGFAHNPIDYAKQVDCPTLILQGDLDSTVNSSEIESLYQNIDASKQSISFNEAGHQLLVTVEPQLWSKSVVDFLDNLR